MPRLDLEDVLRDMMHRRDTVASLEESLWRRLVPLSKSGDARARKELVIAGLRVNLCICREFDDPDTSIIEMLAIASDALLRAADQFDESSSGDFCLFYEARVRAALAEAKKAGLTLKTDE